MLFLTMPAAFLQLAFLPGFLILSLAGLRGKGPGRTLFLSALFSAVFNLLTAYFLTLTGCFSTLSVRILFFFELEILFCILLYDRLPGGKAPCPAKTANEFLSADRPKTERFLFLAACAVAGWAAVSTILSAGDIFRNWDAVLSWNRWAVEWTQGRFPAGTRGYPRLVPANWAMAYLLCGRAMEFVPHAVSHYLGFLTLLEIFELGIRQKKSGLFLAVLLFAFFLGNLTLCRDGGEADLYIIFFGFSAVYLLFLLKESERWLPAALIAAAGAAAAKQSGVFLWFLYPAAIFAAAPSLRRRKTLLCHLAAGLVIAAPFYAEFGYHLMKGTEKENVRFLVNGIYQGKTLPERGAAAAKMFLCKLCGGLEYGIAGPRHARFDRTAGTFLKFVKFFQDRCFLLCGAMLTVLTAGLFLMRNQFWKKLILFWCVPYLLVWSFTFSYDLRNLGPVLALLACGIGIAMQDIAERKYGKRILGGLLIFLAAGYGTALRDRCFIAERNRLSEKTGNHALNEMMRCVPLPGTAVATDYEFLGLLTKFGKEVRYLEYSTPEESVLKLHDAYAADPAVGAFLVPFYAAEPFREKIRNLTVRGEFVPVFSLDGYTLFIRRLRR